MKSIQLIFLIFLVFVSTKSNGQTISDLSIKICDSIKNHKYIETDTIELKQINIYTKFLTEYLQNIKNAKNKDFINNFNSVNYKLTRELNKTCDRYVNKISYFLPYSNLVEIDSVFSIEQRENILKIAKEIRNINRMEILVLSIDDLYPYQDITEFSFQKLNEWKSERVFKKGGVIIVFSKKLRLLRISTTEISKKYLTDENCDKIVNEILIPSFKKDKYYEGIYNSLIEIENKIK